MISKIRISAKNMSLYNVKSSFLKENGEDYVLELI